MTQTWSDKKYFSLIIAIVGAAIILSIPIIYGHFFHAGDLFYIAIHESGFILVVFLTVMTTIAYKKTKLKRMLFSSAAFGILAFGQGEIMYQMINEHDVDKFSSGEVLEYCVVIMMVLFAIGIFYKR